MRPAVDCSSSPTAEVHTSAITRVQGLWIAGEQFLEVFTTRPDTLFGATYMVIAPEHPLLDALTAATQRKAVQAYVSEATTKSDLQRTELQKQKTGVPTGCHFASADTTPSGLPLHTVADLFEMRQAKRKLQVLCRL